jgi:hypothetical protein
MSDEAVQDTTLPILDSISIKDPIVDRGEGDNNVTVVLAASDADSEVASIRVTVTDPDGGTMVKTLSAASGELTFTISDDKPEGEYKVTEVVVTDTAGNARTYDGPNLSSLFEVAVTVVNAEEDITPPVVTTLEVHDPIVDFASGDRSVSITVTVIDDLAGVELVQLYLPYGDEGFRLSQSVATGATHSFTFTLPDNVANGTTAFEIAVYDKAGNWTYYSSSELQSMGFAPSVEITGSIEDTEAPTLDSLISNDPVINVSEGDRTITFSYSAIDDLSGLTNFSIEVYDPEGNWMQGRGRTSSSGSITFSVPENAVNGIYTIKVVTKDVAGNMLTYSAEELQELGFISSFEVTQADTDTTPPSLVAFTVDEPVIDFESGDREITVSVKVSDDKAGIDQFRVYLASPTGQQLVQFVYGAEEESVTFVLPDHFSNGEYSMQLYVRDLAGNDVTYTYQDILEQGFSGVFEVSDGSSGNDDTLPGGNDDGDHDNGHGNDEDGVDDDNPGNSDGSNGGGNGGGDHDDNGHGNDEDGVDESNPGNSTGTHRRIKGTDDNDTITGSDDNDTITGGDGDDNLEAGDGNDQIWAGANDTGNDRLAGGRGNDVIGGGKGNDLLVGGNRRKGDDDSDDDGSDILYGGDGDDTLIGGGWDDSSGDGTFSLGEEASDELEANSLWGGDGDDLIIGANGADTVGGGVGNDRVNAGGGNDKVFGGRGGEGGSNDVIDGGDGNDVVFASDGNDSVLGGDGDDDLFGGSGDDTVHGGDGDDTIWGGAGDDLFTGGGGGDIFAFGATSGKDTVTDFSVAEDELRLTGTVTDFTDTASVAAAATVATVAGQAGLLIDTGGGNSVFLVGLTVEDLSNMVMLLD